MNKFKLAYRKLYLSFHDMRKTSFRPFIKPQFYETLGVFLGLLFNPFYLFDDDYTKYRLRYSEKNLDERKRIDKMNWTYTVTALNERRYQSSKRTNKRKNKKTGY